MELCTSSKGKPDPSQVSHMLVTYTLVLYTYIILTCYMQLLHCIFAKLSGFYYVVVTCELSSFHKARKLAVTHDHTPVSSGGKPMNDGSKDVNKDTTKSNVESKQITQDSRPKEGQPLKLIFHINVLSIICQGKLELIYLRCAVSETAPVQNQAAAQKLLQKMSQAVPEDRRGRGHRFKGKGKEEDSQVFTLDEWEKRKAIGSKSTAESYMQDTSRDEELARQLQEQLDLEDMHVSSMPYHDHGFLSSLLRTLASGS